MIFYSKHFLLVTFGLTAILLQIACNNPFDKGSDKNDSTLSILALLAGSGSVQVQEPRPFRWRTVSVVGNDRRIHVYDWNFDTTVSQSNPESGIITGIDRIHGSSSGRFSYLRSGGNFEIIDSTMNLAPHGNHFHYNRDNSFIRVRRDRFSSLNLNTPVNTTPHNISSKSGWVSFLFQGESGIPSVVRFVQEKRIGELSTNIPVWQGPTLGNAISGDALLISGWDTRLVALVPSISTGNTPTQFQVHTATKGVTEGTILGGWTKSTTLGVTGDIDCPSYSGIAATQVPSPNAIFTNLENSYSKLHYIILACGTNLRILIHNDDNGTTELRNLTTGGVFLKQFQPLFQNDNIERGSRDAIPLFLANTNSGTESKIYIIDPRDSSRSITNIDTEPYPSHLIGSDSRSGTEIYIVSNTGSIITYDRSTSRQIRRMPSRVSTNDLSNVNFYGTWFGTALMTQGDSIREYNLRENFAARTISLQGSAIHGMSLKGFFGPGSNYTGPPHNSLRNTNQKNKL